MRFPFLSFAIHFIYCNANIRCAHFESYKIFFKNNYMQWNNLTRVQAAAIALSKVILATSGN